MNDLDLLSMTLHHAYQNVINYWLLIVFRLGHITEYLFILFLD